MNKQRKMCGLVPVYSQDDLNCTYYRWDSETDSPTYMCSPSEFEHTQSDMEEETKGNLGETYADDCSTYRPCRHGSLFVTVLTPPPPPPDQQGMSQSNEQSSSADAPSKFVKALIPPECSPIQHCPSDNTQRQRSIKRQQGSADLMLSTPTVKASALWDSNNGSSLTHLQTGVVLQNSSTGNVRTNGHEHLDDEIGHGGRECTVPHEKIAWYEDPVSNTNHSVPSTPSQSNMAANQSYMTASQSNMAASQSYMTARQSYMTAASTGPLNVDVTPAATSRTLGNLPSSYTISSSRNFTSYTPDGWNGNATPPKLSKPPAMPSPELWAPSHTPHRTRTFATSKSVMSSIAEPNNPQLETADLRSDNAHVDLEKIPLPDYSPVKPVLSWRQRRERKPVTFEIKPASSNSVSVQSPPLKSHRLSVDIKNQGRTVLSPHLKPRVEESNNQSYTTSSDVTSFKRSKPSRWSLPAAPKKPLFLPDSNDSPGRPCYPHLEDSVWISTYRRKHMVSEVPYIDSHCHLDYLFTRKRHTGSLHTYLHSTDPVTTQTVPANFAGCLAIFCDPCSWKFERRWKALLSEDNIWGSFGVHPKLAEQWNAETEVNLRMALKHPKVRALGEIGLDYSKGLDAFKEKQQEAFRCQISIALELKLPLVIHCRDAELDCWAIMTEMLPTDYKIHRHCFTNSWYWANRWLSKFTSLMIGLTPLVTFSFVNHVHQVARAIPLDRLLLETDAPYFVPTGVPKEKVPHTHPAMAITVAAEVAALKNVGLDLVLQATRNNTNTMYGI